MTNDNHQQTKAKQFHKLHHSGKMLVFPNIWDSLGAILLEELNYPAVATASASVAFANGYKDGENIPFDYFLTVLTRIVNSVTIPVTADIESGYAYNEKQLEKNIKELIATGIVGINIEDTDKKTKSLLPSEIQCDRIRSIKNISMEMGVPLFINARTDVYIHGNEPAESKLKKTIERGLAYKSAGADCFFPIAMRKEEEIKAVIQHLQMPVNILLLPGVPELSKLDEIGITRVSLGPGFLKIAIKAMKDMAVKLKNYDGLSEITSNEITSDYLNNLVSKNQ
ncbi:isocitrate lyase/phosphoenolpyruvate mutase family protein [soil metagenome]